MKLEKDAAIQKKLLQLIKINSGQSNIQWSIVLFCLTSSGEKTEMCAETERSGTKIV